MGVGKWSDPQFQQYKEAAEALQEKWEQITAQVEGYFETQYEERLREIVQEFGGPFVQVSAKRALVFAETNEDQVLFFADEDKFFQWALKRFKYEDTTLREVYKRRANLENFQMLQSSQRSYVEVHLQTGDAAPQRVVLELFDEECPQTCRFLLDLVGRLVRSVIHRVKAGAWIQGGDLVDGSGRHSVLEDFRDESFAFKHDKAGMLGLANGGFSDTNGSQFYITLAALPFLDGKHVIFGRVISGMLAIAEIGKVATKNERPKVPVQFSSTKILRRTTSKVESEQDKAATTLQCLFRAKRAQERSAQVKMAAASNRAARIIQSSFRARRDRLRAKQMRSRRRKSVCESAGD